MQENRLRKILSEGASSVATRMWTTWPTMIEALGATGYYDYVEYLAEYSPFSQDDLENMARAAELHNMGSMIKADRENRGYVVQKAIASGFQAVLFTDCHNEEEVKEAIFLTMPETPQDAGCFGYPNRRFIGFQPFLTQMEHAKRQREIVRAFMIEKKSAVDRIEEICSIPGVDMVQFGPSDYSMSCGYNLKDNLEEVRAVERRVIAAALKHGVQPRCEIQSAQEAQYYMDLGVKHFCIGDQYKILEAAWNRNGSALHKMIAEQKACKNP